MKEKINIDMLYQGDTYLSEEPEVIFWSLPLEVDKRMHLKVVGFEWICRARAVLTELEYDWDFTWNEMCEDLPDGLTPDEIEWDDLEELPIEERNFTMENLPLKHENKL